MTRLIALTLAMLAGLVTTAAAQYCPSTDDGACSDRWNALGFALSEFEDIAGQALGPEAAQCFAADNARWRDAARVACAGDACVNALYADRMSSLLVFVPEAETVEGVDFVTTPQLVAVIAPEFETAEPADPERAPDFEARGMLLQASEDINHMGLALKDARGRDLVLVQEMDIGNQPGHALVIGLIDGEPQQEFLVRGGGVISADGEPKDFASNQCRFVYRMPIPDN
ncbi:hypothetical protein [Devosia sp. SL43]|uniref:hypothetical protein n=1 Tax=Devosia sp. SL43 TaxID=2806348 RepID=UPI001F2C7EEE|nr:hypothetical protein [Devosia sp. SL43]UJW83895.1 hypothetical protein IM737_10435 [Devosia sp. SL43]